MHRKTLASLCFYLILFQYFCSNSCNPVNSEKNRTKSVLEEIIEVNKKNGILMKATDNDKVIDDGMFEGDIRLNALTKAIAFGGNDRIQFGATAVKDELWPDGIVYYEIGDDIMKEVGRITYLAIKAAIDDYNKKTCIKVKPRTTQEDYIKFFKGGGCWSLIGRVGGEQQISIGVGCEYKGVVIHEMMHAIGFWHEQSRPDRDKFVEIIYANVIKGYGNQFKKYDKGEIDSLDSPYDYGSVMHYGSRAFSKNGDDTIRILDPKITTVLGQRRGLSQEDIRQIALLYKCSSDKIDGKYGTWSDWSTCDASCDGGSRIRARSCNNPAPKHGGKDCKGPSYEVGKCNAYACTVNCNFESSSYPCLWENIVGDNFNWTKRQGGTPSPYTGPDSDHTTGDGKGHYMYIESSSPRKKGDVAKLSSKYIQGFVTPRCFTFWYNMKGSTIGSISVDLVANSESINLWKLSGDQGAAWKYGTFPISPLSGGYKIIISGTIGSDWRGDAAIDDIVITDDECDFYPPAAVPPTVIRPTTAPRETLPPTTTQLPATTTTLHRTTRKDPTTQLPTTRIYPQTTMTNPPTTQTDPATTRTDPPTSRTDVPTTQTDPPTTKTDPPTTQTDPPTTRTERPTAMTDHLTSRTDLPTSATETWTDPPFPVPPTMSTSVPSTKPQVDDLFCDFESNCPTWKKEKSKLPWIRKSGGTRTRNTGPSADHTIGDHRGKYIYMEASKPAKTGDTARIASKTFAPSEKSCLNFFYHMYGLSMGDLNVYVRNEFDEQDVLLWSMSGNQGKGWKQAKVPLPYVSSAPFQVIIEARRGLRYYSDIAIDDISFGEDICNIMPPDAEIKIRSTRTPTTITTTMPTTIPTTLPTTRPTTTPTTLPTTSPTTLPPVTEPAVEEILVEVSSEGCDDPPVRTRTIESRKRRRPRNPQLYGVMNGGLGNTDDDDHYFDGDIGDSEEDESGVIGDGDGGDQLGRDESDGHQSDGADSNGDAGESKIGRSPFESMFNGRGWRGGGSRWGGGKPKQRKKRPGGKRRPSGSRGKKKQPKKPKKTKKAKRVRNNCRLARASIKVNGKEYSLKRPGHNLVAIDAKTGKVYSKKSYYTNRNARAAKFLARFLKNLKEDTIIAIAVQSTGHVAWHAENTLREIGAKYPAYPSNRASWALVGYKGVKDVPWVTQVTKRRYRGPSKISIKIPKLEKEVSTAVGGRVLIEYQYFPGRQYLPVDATLSKELNFGLADFSILFWIKTAKDGTVISKVGSGKGYDSRMKLIFVERGLLKVRLGRFLRQSKKQVNDNKWHHVALSVEAARRPHTATLVIDGKVQFKANFNAIKDTPSYAVKLGYAVKNYPRQSDFTGFLKKVAYYFAALPLKDIRRKYKSGDSKFYDEPLSLNGLRSIYE